MQVINCKIKTFGIYQFISLAPVNIFDSSNSWEVCVLLKLVKVFLVTERCWRCDKHACTEKSTLLASSEITVTPLPPLCFRSFYIMSQFISDLIDGVTWISQRILHCDLFGKRVGGTLRGKIFHSWSGNEEVSFHPVFQVYPACWRLCPSLAHTTGTLGAMKGPQCAERGGGRALELCRYECGERVGYSHCSLEAFVSDTAPLWGLMRTNWSECNKWIMERDKSLYLVCCFCWDPPIICLLSQTCREEPARTWIAKYLMIIWS